MRPFATDYSHPALRDKGLKYIGEPEVGKKYKNKKNGRVMEVYRFGGDVPLYRCRDIVYPNNYLDISTDSFWDEFEELPEENDMQNRMAKDAENWNKIEKSMNDTNLTFTGKLESKLHLGEKVDDKIVEFNKKNEGKFEPLKAEDLQVKEDVKLPKVGKIYRDKADNEEYLCGGIIEKFTFLVSEKNLRTPWTKELVFIPDFWEFFEELPEDYIEEEDCGCSHSKSIWKYPSELPDKSHYVYLKWNNGEVIPAHYFCNKYFRLQTGNDIELDDSRVVKFCTLTDYMDSIEQRLKKLEGK